MNALSNRTKAQLRRTLSALADCFGDLAFLLVQEWLPPGHARAAATLALGMLLSMIRRRLG